MDRPADHQEFLFKTYPMKAIIKVCTAEKEFSPAAVQFMKRMVCCLIQFSIINYQHQ